ncbi:unnamed protein product [Calypogeia fissa]
MYWPTFLSCTDVDHVGTVRASLITFAAVQAAKPDLIIYVGIAGEFKRKGVKVGDIFLVIETANHDMRIRIGNFVGYGIGPLVATPAPNLVKELALKEGKVSTGNSLEITPKDEEMILANDASLKDMEGVHLKSHEAQIWPQQVQLLSNGCKLYSQYLVIGNVWKF